MHATTTGPPAAGPPAGPLASLYASLDARRRPEDVAATISELLGPALAPGQARVLDRAARGSLARTVWGYTSMLQDFARPVGCARQVAKAVELFASAHPLSDDLCRAPTAVERFAREAGAAIRKAYGASDFKADRLDRAARAAAGVALGHRAYNKRFRLLARLEAKVVTLARELRKRGLQMAGKSGLASRLPWDAFAADADTACFVAYLTARANLRSAFTLDPQQRAFDEIAAMLLRRVERSAMAQWFVVAHAYPAPGVLARLTPGEAGALVGRWHAVLRDAGSLLGELWPGLLAAGAEPRRMIVRRGMDSTTWNLAAGAWNKARDGWIALLHALGLESMLDGACPGKAMRLMAADVAWGHAAFRSGVDPNTEVWASLAPPWAVLAGEAVCTRRDVEAACARVGLDAGKTGWTAPRERTRAAPFRPTPELVHGVAVTNPYLADALRRAGWYAGKAAAPVA
ncbi:hypothetical protein tb265_11120 [Gemmatimonadetes bacterium T265]|nr:hypothetical protein tb265_11120 [Gemmatimonadetes bacterium T265]